MSKYYMIEDTALTALINTLKTVDVKGYDSMNGLVSCVMFLEEVHKNEPYDMEEQGAENNGAVAEQDVSA